MPPPQTEPALLKHLREIADGTRPKPATQARRHHYVPSFLLARWASPRKREGTFYELTVADGSIRPTAPDKSAFERDLYAQDVGKASPNLAVEALLSVIEQYSADPLKALAGAPSTISDQDRAVLAFFIAYQQARTPPGLAQHKMNVHRAALKTALTNLQSRQAFAARYRRSDPDATGSELEEIRQRELSAVQTGKRPITIPDGAVFASMIHVAADIAAVVAMQNWTLLTTDDSEFVICDRALTMFDPKPRYPWTGNAWVSSKYAQAALPVAPQVCLLMTPGTERFSVRKVTKDEVEAINLRSYGWAEQSVFGAFSAALESVRDAAKAQPDRVPRPRLPSTIVVDPVEESDENVGAEHADRGWPRRLVHAGTDGAPQFYAYRFVEIDLDAESIPVVTPEIVEALRTAFANPLSTGTEKGASFRNRKVLHPPVEN